MAIGVFYSIYLAFKGSFILKNSAIGTLRDQKAEESRGPANRVPIRGTVHSGRFSTIELEGIFACCRPPPR